MKLYPFGQKQPFGPTKRTKAGLTLRPEHAAALREMDSRTRCAVLDTGLDIAIAAHWAAEDQAAPLPIEVVFEALEWAIRKLEAVPADELTAEGVEALRMFRVVASQL